MGAPVLAFVVCGLLRARPQVLLESRGAAHFDITKLVNVLFWNLEGWDCISTCSSMIRAPREQTISRGLYIALVVVCLQYLLVLLVAAAIGPPEHPWWSWSDGSLPTIGSSMG